MTVPEKIAEKLLEQAITVGILQKTMREEAVDSMEQAVGIWRERIRRYASKHTEEEGWLRDIDTAEWIDPDNMDELDEAIDQAKTGGYIEGYIDGFADALRARGAGAEAEK